MVTMNKRGESMAWDEMLKWLLFIALLVAAIYVVYVLRNSIYTGLSKIGIG